MSFLSYIIIGILSIVLIIFALFYLAKGLLALMCWFLKFLPTIIKTTIYWAVLILIYSVLKVMDKAPTLPVIVYPVLYFVIMALILVQRFVKYGSLVTRSGGSYKGYVLNKKSKVIHEKYSDSEETISSHHRKELSYLEAVDLINNNEKYRFKK